MSNWEDEVNRHSAELVRLTFRAADQGPEPLPEDEVAQLGRVIALERQLLIDAMSELLEEDDPDAAANPGVAEFDAGFLYGLAFARALDDAKMALDRVQRGRVLKLVKGNDTTVAAAPVPPGVEPGTTTAMTLDGFKASLDGASPPPGLPPALLALWHDAKGDWDAAHGVAQDVGGEDGAWVHAYLHRKEGDAGNAGYWYRHAGRPHSRAPLPDEWDEIASALLERDG